MSATAAFDPPAPKKKAEYARQQQQKMPEQKRCFHSTASMARRPFHPTASLSRTRYFHSTPCTATNPHPSFPPNQPSKQRTSTIPLPRAPLRAPSPTTFAPPAPATPRPAVPNPRHRVIEPTPDIRLPPKYKPAARRVTAIIVGIPIILVVGWDLYGRWRGEVRRKWGEKE